MAEKIDFSQTCNRLSRYLKENKASFGDIGFSQNDPAGKSPAMKLFPQHTGFGNTEILEPLDKAGAAVMKQMTIIYGGKVVVFDDITTEKVKEVLVLANNANLQNNSIITRSNCLVELVQRPVLAGVLSPPQTRNASLRLFLQKRKDRIKARAPYQVNASVAATTEADETKTWLGLGLGLKSL